VVKEPDKASVMSWVSRHRRTVVAFLGGSVALVAAAAFFGGWPVRACSAVGYANISPIELQFDPALHVDTVAACFGPDCQPVALSRADGQWSVPQSQEYLQSIEPGSITHVTVMAAVGGDVIADQVAEVGRERERGSGWPGCPGPFRYLPVTIGP
jgi:hypothetical protein